MLLDNGVDMHSYQPTADDILKISDCDLFIYVGGESDEWVDNALQEATNQDMVAINLLEVLGDKVKEEEIVEGMQVEEDDEHEHEGEEHHHEGEGHHHHDDEEEIEYDEHVWLSIKNARLLCAAIAEELCAADEKNAAMYRKNLSAYDEKLAALDADYTAAVKSAVRKTLLFGDRFPFRYLTDDYGLHYYAAFVGCSAETEASFKTVAFLSAKADELSLPAVLQIETGDGKIAGTIIQNTKAKSAKILTLDSMQSTTAKQIAAGTTYLDIMEKNLAVLEEALGE